MLDYSLLLAWKVWETKKISNTLHSFFFFLQILQWATGISVTRWNMLTVSSAAEL